eukprot:13966461-Alexandrium_andersonii.AAC.1
MLLGQRRPDRQTVSRRQYPQSAMWDMQRRFVRSELELRGPRNGFDIGPMKLLRGALCAVVRANFAPADDSGDRGGPKPRKRE